MDTAITLTEALSEINLIKKKITAKEEKIKSSLFRVAHMPDPFASENGSVQMIASEYQSMKDLQTRLQALRASISDTNLGNSITISGDTRSIHDWLVWKREIAKPYGEFCNAVYKMLKTQMDTVGRNPQVYKDANDQVQIVKYEFHADAAVWLKEYQNVQDKLEKLDGQLSLKNATLTIRAL